MVLACLLLVLCIASSYGNEPSTADNTLFADALDAAGQMPRLHSLLISHKGELVLEKYFNGRNSRQTANVKSVSKSWISALVGIAIEQGYIEGLDQPISEFYDEMKSMLNDGGYPDYSFATVAQYRPEPSYIGRTMSEINRLVERPDTTDAEIETVLDMMVEGGEAGSTYGASMIYHFMSLEDVDTIFRYPNAAVASDGTIMAYGRGQPHPRSYGTNARMLGDFVRERHVLTLEDAIRRMTSLPARTFSFHYRGIVRPGFAADLVLFDPEIVADKATFEDPHQYSVGFDYVIVNGVAVVAEGEMTDERSGQFVKGPGAD